MQSRVLSFCYFNENIYFFLPGIIDDCNASTIRGTYLVQVECHFNGTVIGGILILLLHNDPKESGERGKIIGKNIIRKSDTSVVTNGRVHGSYYFTIHPVLKKLGILGSRIPFGQRINIPKLETSVLGMANLDISKQCDCCMWFVALLLQMYLFSIV